LEFFGGGTAIYKLLNWELSVHGFSRLADKKSGVNTKTERKALSNATMGTYVLRLRGKMAFGVMIIISSSMS
jgi:hypothetical protein